jgi:general secretion pathway protein J
MSARRASGFTLIEVVVALAILAALVGMTLQNMTNTVRGRDIVLERLARPKVANAVLSQIVKDLRYLWFGGLTGNAGFSGRGGRVGSFDGDRVDFVTARLARSVPLEEGARQDDDTQRPALSEVGYALRPRDDGTGNELWRREDPYVDDDPTNGGSYSLIYDRVRDFNLTYFDRPGVNQKARDKGAEDWDSRIKKRVPYAIILQMTFDAVESDDPRDEGEPERIVRIFLLKPGSTAAVDWPASGAAPGGAAMN